MTALILVILVASGEADSPASHSMLQATSDTLGLEAQVSVHEIDPNAGDSDVIAAGAKWHADAVARVSWQDGHRHALVHLHGDASPRWIDREIGFNASDAEDERGRTIGFAVISMLPEGVVPHAPPPPPSQPETPKKQDDSRSSIPDEPTLDEEDRDAEPPPHRWNGSLDASGIGAVGFGGDATGLGGAIRGQWFYLPDFSLRAGGGARFGTISEIGASSLTFFGSGGISWHPTNPSRRHPFGIGASLDATAMHYALSRTGTGGVAESQSRWIPAADLMLEGSWFFSEPVGLVVAVGGEMTFGATDVYVENKAVETIPSLRGVAEIGGRVRF
jgi:hypothetical protein